MAASLNQMNNNNNTYLPAAPLSLITMETWQLQLHNLPIMVNVIHCSGETTTATPLKGCSPIWWAHSNMNKCGLEKFLQSQLLHTLAPDARRRSWLSTTLTSGSLASRITRSWMEFMLLTARKNFCLDSDLSNMLLSRSNDLSGSTPEKALPFPPPLLR